VSVSYVIPTHNRPSELRTTLAAIGRLEAHDAEVIVVDNASSVTPIVPSALVNGIGVRLIELDENRGAAGRNAGVEAAAGEWVVMLDDDSSPMCTHWIAALAGRGADVAAVLADIHLPVGDRESGGLPEVFIGCGVAIRRDAFIEAGGYDAAFGYYAEEYDLAARFIANGLRMEFDPEFTVEHRKTTTGRDMDQILGRLVRNNGWVMQRYAPETERRAELLRTRRRYRSIAGKEGASRGYAHGVVELKRTIRSQERRALSGGAWARFTGLDAARGALGRAMHEQPFLSAAIVRAGKNAHIVELALGGLGIRIIEDEELADALVIGTLSPGPMLDAVDRLSGMGARVIAPWSVAQRVIERRTGSVAA